MTDPVRITVLGTGRIGAMHAELIARRIDGAELAGVFDVHAPAAQAVGAELGAPVYDTLEAALAGPGDAVCIATSTDTHVSVMQAAAQAGKAIFCEKPISLDVAQVDAGLAAVDAAGVMLQIGFNRRFDPSHKAVADAVDAGTVGTPQIVRITSRDPEPPPISYIEVSGGIFNDMTIHDFDMVTPPSSPCGTRTAQSRRSTTAAKPCTATTSGSKCSEVRAWSHRTIPASTRRRSEQAMA